MEPRSVTAVTALDGFRLHLTFDDGREGVVEIEGRLWGPMFDPLRDPDEFARVRVDPEAGTIVWPNGADLAPDMLYDEVTRSTSAP